MAEGNIFAEKRLHPRIPAAIPVKYKLIEDHGEIKSIRDGQKKNLEGESIDISLGGLYISSKERLTMGNLMKIEMQLDKKHGPLIAFAEVAWANETGGGLKFLSMREDDVVTLKNYIEGIS